MLAVPTDVPQVGQRSSERLCVLDARHGWSDNAGLGVRDAADSVRTNGETSCFLSQGTTRRSGVEAGRGTRGSLAGKRERRPCCAICELVSRMLVDLCLSVWHRLLNLWSYAQ